MKACLTTCVDYGDILHYTLPRMLANFDRVLVVTAPRDVETQEVVERHGGDLLSTDAFHVGGAPFNKARATRRGIEHLRLTDADWLALVDADVFLPEGAHEHLRHKARHTIHGCTRRMCQTSEAWQQFLQDENRNRFRKSNARRLGVVLGYFQFFSVFGFRALFPNGYVVRPGRVTAMRVDLEFAQRWQKQEWMSFECIHLGPEEVNWSGRKSPRFHVPDHQQTA